MCGETLVVAFLHPSEPVSALSDQTSCATKACPSTDGTEDIIPQLSQTLPFQKLFQKSPSAGSGLSS